MRKEEIIITLNNSDRRRQKATNKRSPINPKKKRGDLGRRRVSSISEINFYDLSEIQVSPGVYASLFQTYFPAGEDIEASWNLNVKPRLEDCLVYTPSQMKSRYRRIDKVSGENYRLYLNLNNELGEEGVLKRTTRRSNTKWKETGLSLEPDIYPIQYLQVLPQVTLGSGFTYRCYERSFQFVLFPVNDMEFGNWDSITQKCTRIPDINAPHLPPSFQLLKSSKLDIFLNPAVFSFSYLETEPSPSMELKLGILPRSTLFEDETEFQEGENSEALARFVEIMESTGLLDFNPTLSSNIVYLGQLISVYLIDNEPYYIWFTPP